MTFIAIHAMIFISNLILSRRFLVKKLILLLSFISLSAVIKGRSTCYESFSPAALKAKEIANALKTSSDTSHITNLDAKDNYKQSPLFYASFYGSGPQVISFLLKHGADPYEKDAFGTPVIFTLPHKIDYAKAFLDVGLNINITNKKGDTLLHKTIAKISDRLYCDCEVTGGENIDTIIKDGNAYIEALIQFGISINQVNNKNETALIRAAFFGLDPIIELLLNHDADTSIKDENGYTALKTAEIVFSKKIPLINQLIENKFFKRQPYQHCIELLRKK